MKSAGEALGATGGSATHTHLPHPNAAGCVSPDNIGVILPLVGSYSPDTNHSTSNNLPPYVSYKYIQRTT